MKLSDIICNIVNQSAMAGWGFIASLLLLTACERRELYVYGEEFKSARINVDWREYSYTNPDGMTMWFYPADTTRSPYRNTTANVRQQELYLPGGIYQGVVIDYSPEEYSHQLFFDLNDASKARVVARPAAYQPDSLPDLYSTGCFHEPLPSQETTGYFTVSDEPEEMALDTLKDMNIYTGEYGDYIPYKERDTYQSTLTITDFESIPHSIIEKCRVLVYIQGIQYLWKIQASIAGMADGRFLVQNKNTDSPCLISLDEWEIKRTGDNEGYIAITFNTFGLRPSSIKNTGVTHTGTPDESPRRAPGDIEPEYPDPDWYDYITDICDNEELRLNLHLTLRDHETEMLYHFDVGKYVVSYLNQNVLRIDLGKEDFKPYNPDGLEPIVLPYVEPYNGTGFDADVTDWEDEPPVDIDF